MTNIMFRPNLQLSKSDSHVVSRSASYNEDPYDYSDDPLSEETIEKMDEMDKMVNTNKQTSITYGETTT